LAGVGKSLALQLQEAVRMKIKHTAILSQFTSRFSPELINQWNNMIETWDNNHDNPNPYEEEKGKGVYL
jgi:hypothetical protein